MTFIFQFAVTQTSNLQQSQPFVESFFFWLIFIIVVILTITACAYLLRSFFRSGSREAKAFNRTVLRILVPKERKSDGQGGKGSETDRLEQVKEEIGITETFFASIAGLRAGRGVANWLKGRSDHFSCEMVVQNQLIYFYIDVPKKAREMVEQQIHAQYPYAEIEEMTDYNIFHDNSKIVGAYLKAKLPSAFPFKTYKEMDSDPISATLNVLSKIRDEDSSAAIQFIVRSSHRKWRRSGIFIVREIRKGKKFESLATRSNAMKLFVKFSELIAGLFNSAKKEEEKKEGYQLSPLEEEMIKGIEEKLSKGGLDISIRLLSSSGNQEVAKLNLDNLVSAFSQYNHYRYGNSFEAVIPRNQSRLIRDFIYRSFDEKRSVVVNTEEMAGFWHLPLASTEAPNIKWLNGRQSPPPTNLPDHGLLLGYVDYRGVKKDVRLMEADRRRHLYIIGKSGSGKSVTIANLAIQDIKEGRGIAVIDPHGDLIETLLQHVPKDRADDVIVFDPSDMERPIGLNMLEASGEDQKDMAVQEMIAIFYKLFPPEMIGPMFEHNMRNVMLTLMADLNNPGTIIDIPRMFTDDAYVQKYLKKVKDPVVRAFWEKEMAKTSDFHKSEMLGYLISKVGRFVGNEMMRNIMGQQKSGFNFRQAMDEEKIIFVNLAKGRTGEVNSKLLGLIIVAKLQMAALARADMAEESRKDFYLYIDEFQNFITDSISTILSEARKYKLDLIIAHQYMGQLVDDKGKATIREAVLGNVGTIMIGRIGPEDAEILAKETAPTFGSYDLLNTPQYSFYAKELIDNTASRPFLLKAYPPQQGNPQLASAIKQLSRLKFGRDRNIVSAEIIERTKLDQADTGGKTESAEASL